MYLHHGGLRKEQKVRYVVDAAERSTQLGVELPAGDYRTEWIDTKSGKVAKQERFAHKGGTRALISPQYTEDIAVRIQGRRR